MLTLFEQAELTETSLSIPDDIEDTTYTKIGQQLARMEEACQWWIGDWLIAGHKWDRSENGREHRCERAGIKYNTARRYAWVCERIKDVRRRTIPTFTHHEIVAELEPTEQDHWLHECEVRGWKTQELATRLSVAKDAKQIADEMPETKDEAPLLKPSETDSEGWITPPTLPPPAQTMIRRLVRKEVTTFCDRLNVIGDTGEGEQLILSIKDEIDALLDALDKWTYEDDTS